MKLKTTSAGAKANAQEVDVQVALVELHAGVGIGDDLEADWADVRTNSAEFGFDFETLGGRGSRRRAVHPATERAQTCLSAPGVGEDLGLPCTGAWTFDPGIDGAPGVHLWEAGVDALGEEVDEGPCELLAVGGDRVVGWVRLSSRLGPWWSESVEPQSTRFSASCLLSVY